MKKKILVPMFLLVLIFSLVLSVSTTAYAKGKPPSTEQPGCKGNACKDEETTMPISGNPSPMPEKVCGSGWHTGNPHCSDQDVDPTTDPTVDPTTNPSPDPTVTPDPTQQTPDPTDSPTLTETVIEPLVVGQAIIPVTGEVVCPCCDIAKVDIMSMDNFEFQTWYKVTINSQNWEVAVYQGSAKENNLVITEECFCNPFVVNPELDKVITVVVVSPENIKSVAEISVEILE